MNRWSDTTGAIKCKPTLPDSIKQNEMERIQRRHAANIKQPQTTINQSSNQLINQSATSIFPSESPWIHFCLCPSLTSIQFGLISLNIHLQLAYSKFSEAISTKLSRGSLKIPPKIPEGSSGNQRPKRRRVAPTGVPIWRRNLEPIPLETSETTSSQSWGISEGSMKNLVELNLAVNNITDLAGHCFRGLPNLLSL